jgi:hypothetical protein
MDVDQLWSQRLHPRQQAGQGSDDGAERLQATLTGRSGASGGEGGDPPRVDADP